MIRTIAALILIATPALAQQQPTPPCMPRAALEKQIKTQYGESTVGAGLNAVGAVYVMANPQSGSFTIIQLRQDNIACIISGGRGWVSLPPTIPGTNL